MSGNLIAARELATLLTRAPANGDPVRLRYDVMAQCTWFERQRATLALALLALREGRFDEVTGLLSSQSALSEPAERPGFLLRRWLLLAVAEYHSGDTESSLTHLGQALAHGQRRYFVRLFCDLEADRAVRVVALESSKQRASEMFPEITGRNAQQMRAYREMPDDELFRSQWVRVKLGPEEFPGFKGERAICAQCGEGINFKREVVRDERVLCKSCAGERYYEPL